MALSIKKGVCLAGMRPEIGVADQIVECIYNEYGLPCEITSGCEGKHSKGSLHYVGAAHDYSIHCIPTGIRGEFLAKCRARLGEQYDAMYEHLGSPNEHLHVEFQPKVRI